jgi:uncharacterized protein
MEIVDRRLNPKGKSLPNRQRFMAREKAQIRRAIDDDLKKHGITQEGSKNLKIHPTTKEPEFRKSRQFGKSDYVVPGNKQYRTGDEIPRPAGGGGGIGGEASNDGSGEDGFIFNLTEDEYLDILFADMELPDLAKKQLKETQEKERQRSGYATTGTTSALAVQRTMIRAKGRHIAFGRPKPSEIEEAEKAASAFSEEDISDEAQKARQKLLHLRHKARVVPFLDDTDVRYRRYEFNPKPNTQAVMFCLMDVSGSMTEEMKDLAKRFYMLLYRFLKRNYKKVDVVFIRHTSIAQEVDENTFFYSPETGGTVVSTALEEMLKIAKERYPSNSWNIYGAQASDGDNYGNDSAKCVELLQKALLPLVQYYAYVEIGQNIHETDLGKSYKTLQSNEKFAMSKVAGPKDIYPVLHELFHKRSGDVRPIAAYGATASIRPAP